jgi:hypothetical protein
MAKHLVPVDGGLYVPVVRDEIREHHARGVAKGVVRVLYIDPTGVAQPRMLGDEPHSKTIKMLLCALLTQFQATDLGGLPAFSNATVKRDRSAGTEGQ